MTTILPITLTMAGAAAIINLWLGYRVGQVRMATKITIGDGGNDALIRRMRAQANFIEYTPIFLILLGLVELASEGSAPTWLWVVGALFIIGRVCHGLGMDVQGNKNPLRAVGIMSSMILTLGLAIYAVYLPSALGGTITDSNIASDSQAMSQAETVPAE